MPDYKAWQNTTNSTKPTEAQRARDAWRRIQDKPTSIELWRDEVVQSAQTMRVEWDNVSLRVTDSNGSNTLAVRRFVVIFGVRNHPMKDDDTAPVPDTDIQQGDVFGIDGADYIVDDVIKPLGEVQARAYRLE